MPHICIHRLHNNNLLDVVISPRGSLHDEIDNYLSLMSTIPTPCLQHVFTLRVWYACKGILYCTRVSRDRVRGGGGERGEGHHF